MLPERKDTATSPTGTSAPESTPPPVARSSEQPTSTAVETWVAGQLAAMDPAIKVRLDSETLAEIRRVLRLSARIPGTFAVDVRFTLHLLVTRIFVVFIMGRDRRRTHRLTPLERRAAIGRAVSGAATIGCATVLVLALLGLLYVLKSWLGINIFPDAHLRDILGLR